MTGSLTGHKARLLATAVAVLAWLALLGVSAYATVLSNVDPQRLSRPLLPGWHVRIDTSAAVAYGCSVAVFVVWQWLTRPPRFGWRTVVSRTCILYGLFAMVYTAAHAITRPHLLRVQLTHLVPWPTEEQFGLIGLILCAVGLVLRTRSATLPRGSNRPKHRSRSA